MTARRFPWTRTFLVGFGFLGISIIWPIFNQYIPLFLQAGNAEFNAQLLKEGRALPDIVGFGLTPALAMFIMTWDNLINIFVQPWVGAKSDRTWNRFGRRKPWIMLGLPIAALGFIAVPFAQSVLAIMVFILITNFGMSLFRSPTISWLGDMFRANERSKANGVINLMGGLGGLLAYFAGGMLFNAFGRNAPFIGGAVAMIVALVVVLFVVKEPEVPEGVDPDEKVERDSRKNVIQNLGTVITNADKSGMYVLLAILLWFIGFNALETGLSSFAVFSLGIPAGKASIYASASTLSFLAFSIPAGLIAGKLGRRRTIMIGITGLIVSFAVGYFVVQNTATFIGALVVIGMFWSMINVNSLPMVYDYGDERRIGAYTGLYYFSSQTAAVLGPTLGGLLVDTMGNQYRWLFVFSTIFMIFAWMAMKQVKEKVHAPAAA